MKLIQKFSLSFMALSLILFGDSKAAVKTYCSNPDGSFKRVSQSDYVRDAIVYIHHGKVLSLFDAEASETNKQVLSRKEVQSPEGIIQVETYSAFLSVKQNNGDLVAKDWVSCRSEKLPPF